MEISDKHPNINLAYVKQVQHRLADNDKRPANEKNNETGDVVALSATVRDLQKAGKALEALPEVRLDQVQRIREAIEAGSYHIDRAKIADRMLRESLLNDLVR
ncbi:MAG TPA: flagellar biosynthesis anti-sigma factor FlgM [Desulfobacterales bacterium]